MVESEAQKSPCAQRFLHRKEHIERDNEENAKNEINKQRKDVNKSLTPRSTPRRTQTSSSIRSVSSSTYSEFEKSCLKAHNEFRSKHGVPLLKLNRKLCRFSDEWAKVSYHMSMCHE